MDDNINSFSLDAREVGAAPIVRRIFERLDLDRLLETYVPGRRFGRKADVSHGRALSVMVANAVLSRQPLYAVPEWLDRHIVQNFGLRDDETKFFNDDRIGRALDRLYEADRASLMTAVVTKAIREFKIDLAQIHNDTTTVTFSGAYEGQKLKAEKKRPPLITFGYNKDHRPDLKQLVYSLTISRDGAVPVHYKTFDGNTTDDQTHIDTWSLIRELAGRPDFTYVADSKLCTRENMAFIAGHGGRFVTVLPRSRGEDDDFRDHIQKNVVLWDEVRREKNPRGKDKPDHVYWAFEPGMRSVEGYRIVWYRSSVKTELDQKRRTKKIARARERLQELENRTGAHRFRSKDAAEKAVQKVLQEEGAERWLTVEVVEETVGDVKQIGPGRPGKDTTYRRVELPVIFIEVADNPETIQADARCDGLFAMVSNVENLTPEGLLGVYKYQPFLEKRNEQLKSVLSVAPMFLKKPERVAALLFVYFLAVLVFALIEREVRNRMAEEDITELPLYPEERLCEAPTADVVIQAVEGLRCSRLVDANGEVVKVFHDELTPVAKKVLRLLGVDLRAYGVNRKA